MKGLKSNFLTIAVFNCANKYLIYTCVCTGEQFVIVQQAGKQP